MHTYVWQIFTLRIQCFLRVLTCCSCTRYVTYCLTLIRRCRTWLCLRTFSCSCTRYVTYCVTIIRRRRTWCYLRAFSCSCTRYITYCVTIIHHCRARYCSRTSRCSCTRYLHQLLPDEDLACTATVLRDMAHFPGKNPLTNNHFGCML